MAKQYKRTTVFLDEKDLARLQDIGWRKGGVAVSALIRQAIREFIHRETGWKLIRASRRGKR